MTKQDALKYAALLTAFAEGKTVESRHFNERQLEEWRTADGDEIFSRELSHLRIKPEKVKLVVYAMNTLDRPKTYSLVVCTGEKYEDVVSYSRCAITKLAELEIDPLPGMEA